MQENAGHWIGVVTTGQFDLLRNEVREVLQSLRNDAVALADAFDIPDHVLNSDLGRKDGNVYEALYASAKKSSLNKVDPFDGYEELLRPILDLEYLKEAKSTIRSKL